ncbi:F0F1 ATP synthase subunit delta [Propionivibrio limicola]|uniref:F0F1 ATP synthase subunit delta n=1 Tax=Propionivibrio limicola TaxID=167645 RepID=UPI001290E100|nr:F0F1 ATP synthase subunit delta [Propionivibrio limicola]
MSDFITTARPYAQALFRLAQENQTQELWQKRLQRLALIAEDKEIAGLLGNPGISASQLAELFLSLTDEPDDKELATFISLLAENERFDSLPEMLKVYERLKRIEEGVRRVVIATAFPLEQKQLDDLLAQLESHFGHKLQPTIEVDPELIGGIKVSFTDRVIDISVRSKLDAMAAALKN